MNKLFFLVEGEPEDLSNFSGIPHFFSLALLECLKSINIEIEVIKTNYLLNVEELILCLDNLSQGKTFDELMLDADPEARKKKLTFPLNIELFGEIKKVKTSGFVSSLRQYYEGVSEYMSRQLNSLLQPGDLILSQNHFYPYLGEGLPAYYYLDTSLVDFYFNQEFGTIRGKKNKKEIEVFYREMEKSVLLAAKGVFCFSKYLKEYLHKRYGISLEHLSEVGAGVNLESFPESIFRNPVTDFHLLFVGLDFERKGGQILFKAMEKLQDEPVRLTVVTSTESITNTKIPKNVFVTPPCNKRKLDGLYRAADAFVFPTLFEPFGIVVCEAMSYSLPVISCSGNAIPEILNTNKSYLIIPPHDVTSLVRAIRHLMRHPGDRITIGKYNYLRAKRLFQWNVVSNKIVSHCLSDSVHLGTIPKL